MQESESSFGLSRHTSQIVCRRQTYTDDDDDDDYDTETSPVCFRFQPCACVWPGACVHLAVVSSAIKIFFGQQKDVLRLHSITEKKGCLPSESLPCKGPCIRDLATEGSFSPHPCIMFSAQII